MSQIMHVYGMFMEGLGFTQKKPNLVPFILNHDGKMVEIKNSNVEQKVDKIDMPPKHGNGAGAPFPETSQSNSKKTVMHVPLFSTPSPTGGKDIPVGFTKGVTRRTLGLCMRL